MKFVRFSFPIFFAIIAALHGQYESSGLTEFTQRSQANNDAFRAQQTAAVQQQQANDSLQNIQWQQQQQAESLQQIQQQSLRGSREGSYGDALTGAFALMRDRREDINSTERNSIAQEEEDRRQKYDEGLNEKYALLLLREQKQQQQRDEELHARQLVEQREKQIAEFPLSQKVNADALQSQITKLDDKVAKSNFNSSDELYSAFSQIYLNLIKDGSTSYLPSIPTNDALGMGKAVWDFAHSNHPGASSAREGCITILDEKFTTPVPSVSPN